MLITRFIYDRRIIIEGKQYEKSWSESFALQPRKSGAIRNSLFDVKCLDF